MTLTEPQPSGGEVRPAAAGAIRSDKDRAQAWAARRRPGRGTVKTSTISRRAGCSG